MAQNGAIQPLVKLLQVCLPNCWNRASCLPRYVHAHVFSTCNIVAFQIVSGHMCLCGTRFPVTLFRSSAKLLALYCMREIQKSKNYIYIYIYISENKSHFSQNGTHKSRHSIKATARACLQHAEGAKQTYYAPVHFSVVSDVWCRKCLQISSLQPMHDKTDKKGT